MKLSKYTLDTLRSILWVESVRMDSRRYLSPNDELRLGDKFTKRKLYMIRALLMVYASHQKPETILNKLKEIHK